MRLVFRFDSVDSANNTSYGWFVDDVEITGLACPPANTPPAITVAEPTPGGSVPVILPEGVISLEARYTDTDPVAFTATALDPDDGDLTASIAWRSSLDGKIGYGGARRRRSRRRPPRRTHPASPARHHQGQR